MAIPFFRTDTSHAHGKHECHIKTLGIKFQRRHSALSAIKQPAGDEKEDSESPLMLGLVDLGAVGITQVFRGGRRMEVLENFDSEDEGHMQDDDDAIGITHYAELQLAIQLLTSLNRKSL